MKSKKIKGIIVLLVLFLVGITLVSIVSAGVSDSGVEYDSELIGQFLLNDRVDVMVRIKDTTNITLPHKNSPDFESKINERNEFMITKTNAVLTTLNNDEFQLKSNSEFGGAFSGNITKEGFEKLLRDTRVKKIHDNTVKGHISSGLIIKGILKCVIAILLLVTGLILLSYKLKERDNGK